MPSYRLSLCLCLIEFVGLVDSNIYCVSYWWCQCPPGSSQNSVYQCICDFGFYELNQKCYKCIAGKYQPYYTYNPGCLTCNPGSYSGIIGASKCTLCSIGNYQSKAQATFCESCQIGVYQNKTGASVCVLCPSGTFNPQNASSKCLSCGSGQYQSKSGVSACLQCSAGQFQTLTGQSSCLPCLAGTYQNLTNQTSCLQCLTGTYQNSTGQSSCVQCSAGTYQNTTGQSSCLSCATGTYQNLTNSTGCVGCGPGTYQGTLGSSTCLWCPGATYQYLNMSSTCFKCVRSLYFTGQTVCHKCVPGQFQESNISTTCTLCAIGQSYSTEYGATACQSCTQCSDSQWFTRSCILDRDSSCAPCGDCEPRYYMTGFCVKGSSIPQFENNLLLSPRSQPNRCDPCPTCSTGTFLSDGCIQNKPPICSTCSICEGDTLLKCTPYSDTICANTVHCRSNVSYEVYNWLDPSSYCKQGQYILSVSPETGTPSCAQCPDGTYGPNGLWCELCAGYKTAYWDSTQCVCAEGTTPNVRDACDCGPGMEFLESGCVPCAAGSFSNVTLELSDAWWTQYKACDVCPPGTDSSWGATACTECLYGMYRAENDTTMCQNCSDVGYFAEDPTTPNSCVPCNASCPPEYSPQPCPMYPGEDLFKCVPCADLPRNATSTATNQSTALTACNWECDSGFYKANGTLCLPCTIGDCAPGYNRTSCTDFADSNCDLPCLDPNKPLLHSIWLSGCRWACEDGYELKAVDYLLWVQYSCVLKGSRLFDSWGR